MESRDWLPGDLVVVLRSSVIDRLGTNATQWTHCDLLGLVVQSSHRWEEPDDDDPSLDLFPCYVVYFSHVRPLMLHVPSAFAAVVQPGLYMVSGNRIIDPSEVGNPGRLFGTWPPTA